jgi:hypothetical protein
MREGPFGRRSILVFFVVLMFTVVGLAYGQAGAPTTSLSGVVVDSSGAVIPGAEITVRNNATSHESHTFTDGSGRFTVPALDPGTYTVTVALMGFKTVVLPDVTLLAAQPATVRATLQVGDLEETVVVVGATEIVQTQSATVSSTIAVSQIAALPLATRNAMDFVAMIPGVSSSTTVRGSSYLGLRSGANNVTIDGINVQEGYFKSYDGLFAFVRPNLDAVEEVTVSTATPGAESSGQGAIQVRFVTRQGTNRFQGSVYHYLRHTKLNTSYWFNKRDGLPRDDVKLYQTGFRVGGPIMVPTFFDGRDKAFFFFNFEEFRQPLQQGRIRTIFTPLAQQGVFQYMAADGVRTVNMLELAARNGQVSTLDPTVSKLLSDIRASTGTIGTISSLPNPNLERYTFQADATNLNYYPTTRIDVNMTKNHRLGVTTNIQPLDRTPDTLNAADPMFPGFPNWGGQRSTRWHVSGNLRSVLSRNMVNELRIGGSGGHVYWYPEVARGQFEGTTVANQNGFHLLLSGAGITNASTRSTSESRDSPSPTFQNTLNWVRGSHSLSMGGAYTYMYTKRFTHTVVPSVTFGVDSADSAFGLFTTANFPGASTTDLTNARNAYAVLTGRVTAITASAVLDENDNRYKYLGPRWRRGSVSTLGLFVQDAWRVRPELTLNFGVRYEVQFPFVPHNDTWTIASMADLAGISGLDANGNPNIFRPGTLTGRDTEFNQYQKGTKAFKTDLNNFAPSVGAAWRPNVSQEWLKKIVGSDPVLRGGYSVAYTSEGLGLYLTAFDPNPGGFINADRNMSLGNILGPGETLPVLLREGHRLVAPSFADTPQYPLKGLITDSVSVLDPNLKVPYTHSFTFGIQRTLSKDTALEVRYVGNRSRSAWMTRNYNEVNIVENGFLDEFKKAQVNLQANIAAGRGSNFRYYGPDTGTHPLPIYLAYFSGVPMSQAGDPAKYGSSLFASSSFYNPLAMHNPNPYTPASSGSSAGLYGTPARRANAVAAGLSENFFVMNPRLLGGANLRTHDDFTNFDSLQVELRRRMSSGLLVQGSYVYSLAKAARFYSLRMPLVGELNTAVVPHVFKVNWVYELPFGEGKRYANRAGGVLNRLIGGWEFDGVGRVQSGRVMDFGNRTLVGMTEKELKKLYKVRIDENNRVWMLPKEVIDNTVKAFNVSPTSATGYSGLGVPEGRFIAPANYGGCVQVVTGDCAPAHLFVTGPVFSRFDMAFVKRTPIKGRVHAEWRAEVLNIFDAINYTPNAYSGSNPDSYEVTSAFRDVSNTQDPGGRIMQIVWRLTW